jgi:hypothetical protein
MTPIAQPTWQIIVYHASAAARYRVRAIADGWAALRNAILPKFTGKWKYVEAPQWIEAKRGL